MRHLCIIVIPVLLNMTVVKGQGEEKLLSPVKIWEESVIIPTYLVDDPDLNPRFYEGRAYQGAQGRVYPYPIYESLSDKRIEKAYDMVFLENEYIKIEILPEIGGRMFGALDKTNGYDFVYRQHVIKPGLIGMLGAWISGGIEWNFPHHHRATAYMPVDYVLQENPDGSSTVWIGELEIRHRMKFMLGVSVYPGKSYFEVTFKPFNRTPFVHSFLYFANTGVHTNEEYQVIFPPSTKFGTYHGKNQFINWPVSHEIYNRVDYTDGVDISWWKNHPEWTSIFAWNYEDDFLGGYDHSKKAGTICVSNHHIAPGKKFWTWSTGPRGKLWDEALTETDGPELELMIGGYSDNQPDYSWLQPYESKYLKQYWYPVREIGGAKNANINAAVNLEFLEDQQLKIGFYTTSEQNEAKAVVFIKGEKHYEELIDISPDQPFVRTIGIPADVKREEVKVALFSSDGTELISYQPRQIKAEPFPEVARPPELPEDIQTIEELYLTGQRLEQFYNPSLKPEPYYLEALKRDSMDYRVNAAMGLLCLRKAMYDKAEHYLKTAVSRITGNYTKPRNGEAYYYLGLCQKYKGDFEEACKNLYKATWSQAYHSAAYYNLAELSCMNNNFPVALDHLNRSLSTNALNTKAINLKTVILRRSGKTDKALELCKTVIEYDPLDFWAASELYFTLKASGKTEEATRALKSLRMKIRGYEQSYLELSLDYANAGLWDEAIRILSELYLEGNDEANAFPMIYYYLGYFWLQKDDKQNALKYFEKASEQSPDYCFPFRHESIYILEDKQYRS
jgi:tetratricopeptide (TPR) repeat protein